MLSSLYHFQVDLFQLQVNTLRRYKRHYKLQTRPGLNKAQLAEVSEDSSARKLFISSVQGHFLWALTPVGLTGTDPSAHWKVSGNDASRKLPACFHLGQAWNAQRVAVQSLF